MIFKDEDGNTTTVAYYEGYRFLSNLEDYWYEVSIDGNEIKVYDISGGGHVDELKSYFYDRIGYYDFYTVCYDYSEMLKIDYI